MFSSKTTYNPPEPLDYGKSMTDALMAQVNMAPALYEAESDQNFGRPAYARMEQDIAKNALLGEKKQVDQNGYVVTDDQNFDEDRYIKFNTKKEAILAKAKEVDPSGGVYNKVLQGRDADGTWWENAHNRGFAYNREDESDVVGRWEMWKAEHEANTGQKIETPQHGRNAPMYQRGNTSITANPEEGVVREYVGIESAGKSVYSGGLVDTIGGRQQTEYFNPDGTKTTRQAGFDEDGNFQGTQKFEQDLKQREQQSTISNELGLVSEYGQKATDLYRQQGGIQDALDETERLGAMSAIPQNQTNDIFSLVDNPQPTMFNQNQQNLDDFDRAKEEEDYLSEFEAWEAKTAQEEEMFQQQFAEQGEGSIDNPIDKTGYSKFKKRVEKERAEFRKRDPNPNKRNPNFNSQIGNESSVRMGESSGMQPQGQASARGLNQQMLLEAQQGMQAGGRLTSRELRTAQQGARTASSARGRGRDFSGVLAELNFGEQASRARKMDRQNFAGQVMNTQMGLMDRSMSQNQINTQAYQQGLAQQRGYATQRVGLEQATSADPFQAILGRPSGVSNQAGQATYGNAYAGVNASPQLYNPAQGAQFEANQQAELNQYNQSYMNAEATRKAGNQAMVGQLFGAGATAFAGRNG